VSPPLLLCCLVAIMVAFSLLCMSSRRALAFSCGTTINRALTTAILGQSKRRASTTDRWRVFFSSSSSVTTTEEPQLVTRQDDNSGNDDSSNNNTNSSGPDKSEPIVIPPWNHPATLERIQKKLSKSNNARFRQHVNPLARQFQQPTLLPDAWPAFADGSKPLHLDIGCGKGGFLIDLCRREEGAAWCNYLGLEIRPGVVACARDRAARHQLERSVDFVGCNANVDLDRILDERGSDSTASATTAGGQSSVGGRRRLLLQRTTIQFPDPHFKKQHAKRRVVNAPLIATLARYMPPDAIVFLQSDVQRTYSISVLLFHVAVLLRSLVLLLPWVWVGCDLSVFDFFF
jgi:tRNA (guanine-N7-)-methyltransferase